MNLEIPPGLDWIRGTERGRRWLEALPALVGECAELWSLRLGSPYDDSYVSLVLPATRADGTGAVLKVQFPDREGAHEGAALACWDGDGAVRLLEHEANRSALLIERCSRGTHLRELDPDEALGVMIGLLPRLWKPVAAPFAPLADEAAHWLEELPPTYQRAGEPFERSLLDTALDALKSLSISPGE